MGKYYYLLAQLPSLFFDRSPDITVDDFLKEAAKWLDTNKFSILTSATINNFPNNKTNFPVFNNYQEFEQELQKELYLYRKAKKSHTEYRPFINVEWEIDKTSPLKVEKGLLYLRWQFLEGQSTGHYFDFEFLIIYYLKLQILKRLFTFDKKIGKEHFEKMCQIDKKW